MKNCCNICVITAVIVMTLVGFSGCGDAGGDAKTKSPVMLIASAETSYLDSDVCLDPGNTGTCTFHQDNMTLSVAVKALNPDFDESSIYTSVVITGYHVEFERTDTGVDVPKPFNGACSAYIELDGEEDLSFIMVRADMKGMPPLSYLWQLGSEPSTGLGIIHTTAKVTVWGRTIAGEEVIADPVYFTVNFADWAD